MEIGAATARVQRVARPRGDLSDEQLQRLSASAENRDAAAAQYRADVLAVMAEGASFSAVSEATGLSTNTLQRWKREAEQS